MSHPTGPTAGKRIWSDPDLRQELRLCDRWGIPHSQFLSRVFGAEEPLWLPEDRDKAKAYDLWKHEACPRCQTREADWTDEKGIWHDPPILEPVVHDCPGCREKTRLKVAVQEAARRRAGDGPGAQAAMEMALAGVDVVVERFDALRDTAQDDDGEEDE